MPREEFIEIYLERSEPGRETPLGHVHHACLFLKDNLCGVYEDRPAVCSGYPHLYEPDFVTRTVGMIERIFTRPIVFVVLEELKKSLGFAGRGSRR